MTRCLMIGRYTVGSIEDISENRTQKAVDFIRGLGGRVENMYALLGGYDLVFVVDFPKLETALKASLGLTMMTGISFTTYPAVAVEDFDKMAEKM